MNLNFMSPGIEEVRILFSAFVLLGVIIVAVVYYILKKMESPEKSYQYNDIKNNPPGLASIGGGAGRLAGLVIFSLVKKGLVTVEKGDIKSAEESPGGLADYEEEILKAAGSFAGRSYNQLQGDIVNDPAKYREFYAYYSSVRKEMESCGMALSQESMKKKLLVVMLGDYLFCMAGLIVVLAANKAGANIFIILTVIIMMLFSAAFLPVYLSFGKSFKGKKILKEVEKDCSFVEHGGVPLDSDYPELTVVAVKGIEGAKNSPMISGYGF
ncbi:MAG: DUF2207 domain-containing protein [Chloroflexi bacterium]|nr:DUF2207 domain-containing protein [Chloroflexota bacterium]